MIRDSSLEAFRDLQKSGGLTLKQLTVLIFVFKHQDKAAFHGSVTRADVESDLSDNTQSLGPRFAELEKLGMLVIHGRKESCKTGRMIQGWRVPDKFDDEAQNKKKLSTKKALDQLMAEVALTVVDIEGGKQPLLVVDALKSALGRARTRTKLTNDDETKTKR